MAPILKGDFYMVKSRNYDPDHDKERPYTKQRELVKRRARRLNKAADKMYQPAPHETVVKHIEKLRELLDEDRN